MCWREWEWGDDGWIGYFFWHVSPPLDYHGELPVGQRMTLMVVFFMTVYSLFHFTGDLELGQDVFKNLSECLSLNFSSFESSGGWGEGK